MLLRNYVSCKKEEEEKFKQNTLANWNAAWKWIAATLAFHFANAGILFNLAFQ